MSGHDHIPVFTGIRVPPGVPDNPIVLAIQLSTFNENPADNMVHVTLPDLHLSFLGQLDDLFTIFTTVAARLLEIAIANDQVPTSSEGNSRDETQQAGTGR